MCYRIFIFLISLLLISCRDLVQDEFPDFAPVPTVNSILIADSLIKVQVSFAGKIDTNKLEEVNNALVLLTIEGVVKDTLVCSGDGNYFSSNKVDPLKLYSCDVLIPGYPKVSSSDIIPEPTIIYDIVHINQAGKDSEGQIYPSVKFSFKNDPLRNMYFQVALRLNKYGHEREAEIIEITDPVLLNEGIPIPVFSNEIIQGDSYTITINYTTGSADSKGTVLYPLVLELRSVSKNYYQFLKQQYLYERGRYPDFGSSYIPANLFSNVNGGYGIFAGYSSTLSDTIFPYNQVK